MSFLSRAMPLMRILLAVFAVLFLASHTAYAAGDLGSMFSGALGAVADKASGFLVPVMSMLAGFVVICTLWFATMTGDLMTSQYIFDSGMGEILHLTWTVFRNFVNVGFILVLIGIALLVVLGVGSDKGVAYIKKVAAKLVISLLAINLTFFGARAILTVNDVMATIVFTIPSTVSLVGPDLRSLCDVSQLEKDGATGQPIQGAYLQCKQLVEAKIHTALGSEVVTDGVTSALSSFNESMQKGGIATKLIQDSFATNNAIFAMVNYMYSLTNILSPLIPGAAGPGLLVNAIFIFFTSMAIFLVVLAMFVAFLGRVITIWVLIAVSPLIVFGNAAKALLPGLGKLGGDIPDGLGMFLTAAFLPTMVAFPISIGFIFLLAGLSLNFQPSTLSVNTLLSNTNSLNSVMWLGAALAIMWKGTFTALEKSKVTAGIVGKIKGVGDGGMKALQGLAMNAPIIPLKGPLGTMSAHHAMEMASGLPQRWIDDRRTESAEATRKLAQHLFGTAQAEAMSDTEASALMRGVTTTSEIKGDVKKQRESFAKVLPSFGKAGSSTKYRADDIRHLKTQYRELLENVPEREMTHKELLDYVRQSKYGDSDELRQPLVDATRAMGIMDSGSSAAKPQAVKVGEKLPDADSDRFQKLDLSKEEDKQKDDALRKALHLQTTDAIHRDAKLGDLVIVDAGGSVLGTETSLKAESEAVKKKVAEAAQKGEGDTAAMTQLKETMATLDRAAYEEIFKGVAEIMKEKAPAERAAALAAIVKNAPESAVARDALKKAQVSGAVAVDTGSTPALGIGDAKRGDLYIMKSGGKEVYAQRVGDTDEYLEVITGPAHQQLSQSIKRLQSDIASPTVASGDKEKAAGQLMEKARSYVKTASVEEKKKLKNDLESTLKNDYPDFWTEVEKM